jgi:Flp pilus assembly protein TadD
MSLGTLQIRQKQWTDAQDTLGRLVEIEPNSGEAVFTLGLAYAGGQNYPQAIEKFERARSLLPNDARIPSAMQRARQMMQAGSSPTPTP